jgi:hypothetical protein
VAAAGYLIAATLGHLVPFTAPQTIPQLLLQQLPGDLPQDSQECAASPPSEWRAPGLTLAVHCTDAGLPGGNIYVYKMDKSTDSYAAWNNFNSWWTFRPQTASSMCPPQPGTQGIQVNDYLPPRDQEPLECGYQIANGQSVPAMALLFAANTAAFVVAQGAPGSSFIALYNWWEGLDAGPHPTPSAGTQPTLTPVIASLEQLLPGDIDDVTSECSAHTPKFTPVGLTQGILCNDPGLTNGSVEAFQMSSFANYQKSWANFNTWWGFTSYTPGSSCPPTGGNHLQAEGTTTWYDNFFPTRQGQVLECEWTGTGNSPNDPSVAWTFPTENAFIVAWGGDNEAFADLQDWWKNGGQPLASPTPAPPSS